MSCNCNKASSQNPCGCLEKYPAECINYTSEELTNINVSEGMNLNTVIGKISSYFEIFKDEINNFLNIINLGNGVKFFKGTNLLGQKEFRTLLSSSNELSITENLNEIELFINDSSTNGKGIVQLASQTEVDGGLVNNKAVTPSTLVSHVSNPTNLPNATESQRGIAEIATQAEVDAGTDSSKIVTPDKLQLYVNNEVVNQVINIVSNPTNLPNANESQRGIIEIATQAEVDEGTDSSKAVTPATLETSVTNIITQPNIIPNANESQRGIIEIASTTEVTVGTDNTKAVTPAKMATYVANNIPSTNAPNATESQRGIAEIATQAEVNLGADDERYITPLKMKAAIEGYLEGLNIKPIENRGTISSVDPGGGSVNSNYNVSGDLTSAVLESISGASARILVTMANPMQNTNYVVKTFHQSLGDINEDDNLLVASFKPISTTQFRVSISDSIGGAQQLRLHIDVEQR